MTTNLQIFKGYVLLDISFSTATPYNLFASKSRPPNFRALSSEE
jgi:hypothetical protein